MDPVYCVAVRRDRTTIIEHGLDARELHLPRPLYCATKPVVALAFLALLEHHGLDPASSAIDADGAIVPIGRGLAVFDVMAHRTNLVVPDYWMTMAMPARRHNALFDEFIAAQGTADSERPEQAQYSEVLTWWLLRRTGSWLCGGHFDRYATEHLARLLGARQIRFACDTELLTTPYEGLSTGFLDDGNDVVPMLHGIGRRARLMVSSHFGGYGAPIAMLDWYDALLRAIEGDRREPGAAELFPSRRILARLADERVKDERGAYRSYELGLQIHLHEHGFRDIIGSRAIGHHGGGGSLFGGADPASGRTWIGVGDTFHTTLEPRNDQLRSIARAAFAPNAGVASELIAERTP